jgi:hypothetical protein
VTTCWQPRFLFECHFFRSQLTYFLDQFFSITVIRNLKNSK